MRTDTIFVSHCICGDRMGTEARTAVGLSSAKAARRGNAAGRAGKAPPGSHHRTRFQPRGGRGAPVPSSAAERVRPISLVIARLRTIYGVAITAELALRQQAVEQSPEVADCLRVGVCDPIADQIRALKEVTGHWPEASGNES